MAWIIAADFAAPAGGGPRAELSDPAQDNSCAWDSGCCLVEEFVNIVGWFEVWVRDIQEADERGQVWLQTFIFGNRAPTLGASAIASPKPRTQVRTMSWFGLSLAAKNSGR